MKNHWWPGLLVVATVLAIILIDIIHTWGHVMDILDVRLEKQMLEDRLLKMFKEFHEKTGIAVESVQCNTGTQNFITGCERTMANVRVWLEEL